VRAHTILVIDGDSATTSDLRRRFDETAISVESATDGLRAIECLQEKRYSAVVLDPIIRERLNGYAVLSYIESEQPETVDNLFLLTGMSKQTIQRTAPALVPRLFRKPHEEDRLADAVSAFCQPGGVFQPRRSTLLLVEDDPASAAALCGLAEERGYTVTVTHNGAEALAAIANADFDAYIVDLILPEVDGFAVIEQLRSTRPHLLKRVIATTGIPEMYAQGFDPGAIAGLLRKPIDIVELGHLLSRSRAAAAAPPTTGVRGGR
jgi:CheY-like chemotaxis protein